MNYPDYDLVILATPVFAILDFLKSESLKIPKTTTVIDVGSTKESIMKIANQKFKAGNFVGCHPMAGTENSGAQAFVKNLFQNKTAILLKTKTAKQKIVSGVKALWVALESKPVFMEPKQHDEYMAYISHLPHAVSYGFALTVNKNMTASQAKKYAGAGFKDTSRIAGSDYKMWHDIFFDNKKYLLKSIQEMQKYLNDFEKAITNKDEDRLKDLIVSARNFRRKI